MSQFDSQGGPFSELLKPGAENADSPSVTLAQRRILSRGLFVLAGLCALLSIGAILVIATIAPHYFDIDRVVLLTVAGGAVPGLVGFLAALAGKRIRAAGRAN